MKRPFWCRIGLHSTVRRVREISIRDAGSSFEKLQQWLGPVLWADVCVRCGKVCNHGEDWDA